MLFYIPSCSMLKGNLTVSSHEADDPLILIEQGLIFLKFIDRHYQRKVDDIENNHRKLMSLVNTLYIFGFTRR
ncbi:unnamed protein product [Blepharisma stoltei]|uniref:Uncharacterized protein n=1 Tax=Blepharisma stoltei TaxID=1481888 RepID=A0AAU9KHV2_9CILI|nr:unnamed protein product [Blepharisma stoltei]